MFWLRLAILLAVLEPSLAYGPVHLNFGPPDLAVDGWEAAFATVTGTPFLQLTSLDPPVFGFWGGNYQGVSHESGAEDAFSSFSVLPEGAYLCLMSVPIGSYSLQVIVGSSNSSVSACLESDSGSIFDGSSTAGENVTVTKVVHKQTLESCLTLRACAAATVVNTWKVEEISCHSSCAFCTGTSDVECAIGCNEGRTLQEGENSSGTCVARVPFAPSGLSVSQVTNSSLRLSWVPGLSGGEEVTDHRILLEGVEFVTTSSSEAFVDLFGLSGDTMYNFEVQAISAAGLGDLSDALAVRTGPVLPSAPMQLQGVANRYSVNLSWTPPSYDGGAEVVGYLVTTGQLTWSTDATEVLADGLQGFTIYTFQVQARSVAGLGDSNFTTVQTLEVPPGAVQQLRVQELEQYAISLSWSEPLLNGGSNITGYQIYCEPGLAGDVLRTNVTSENVSVRLEGLSGYTLYECWVAAFNLLGLGSNTSIQARTLPVPPYKPAQLVVLEEDLHHVQISWDEPQGDSGAPLLGYKIYGSLDAVVWYVVVNDTQSNTSWTISDLEMYTAYYFAVAGLNAVGEGEQSNSTSAFTAKQGLPHPPSKPDLNASHSSIQASWTLINDGGTNVTGYALELADADGVFEMVLNVSDSLSATLLNLMGNVSYQVRIRARSHGGALSYPSAAAQVTTNEAVVPSEVEQLEINALAPHLVEISWTLPLDLGGNPLEGYEVALEGTTWQTSEVKLNISELMASETYQFFVYARNGIGRSPGSSITVTMPSPIVPGEPQGLQLNNKSLDWEVPLHNGGAPLLGFEVWSRMDDENWTLQVFTNETYLNLTELIGDTSYRFRVRAQNLVGPGAFVESEELRTAASVPLAPRMLQVVDVEQHQLRLMWQPPWKDGGFPILAYRIWQRENEGDETMVVTNSTENNDTEIVVTSLQQSTQYSFLVAGMNILGLGSVSEESIQVSTLPVLPSSIAGESLSLDLASPSRLHCSWQPPYNGGMAIDFYTVEIKHLGVDDTFRQVDNVTRNASELDELLANETYLVKVFAWNGIGRSLDGVHRTFHTLDATVPGSVDDLSFLLKNFTVEATWKRPMETGGMASLYYQVTATADHQLAHTTNNTSTTIALLGGRVYNLSIVACNALGCGTSNMVILEPGSAEEQALFEGRAASVAALAAGLTSEQAAQAAGEVAANTAQSAGLSPQLQASLAASAAAQSAQVNQLSAEQQTQLAGEAAASAGASANMSMAEVAFATGLAVTSVGTQAGLASDKLAFLAAQAATVTIQQHFNASVSQQADVASAAVAAALSNSSLSPSEEALLTGSAVVGALSNGRDCDAELVAHAGTAAQSAASKSNMSATEQAATSGQAAAQAAASCSMTPAMQAQLSGAAAAAAGAAANVSSEEQTILAGQAASEAALAAGLTAEEAAQAAGTAAASAALTANMSSLQQGAFAGQAASVAALAAGLTSEQAAQAAGTAAANTAQSAGLSPQLQASLAASAAAQSAQVNQLSAEQQTQLAGEAAASAGASANMSMAELAFATGLAVTSVGTQAGLAPDKLAFLAAQAATVTIQQHYNASVSQQADIASAAVAAALSNSSLSPSEEALLTGSAVVGALSNGRDCDAELVAHAGKAAQSAASKSNMSATEQAATSGQAAAQAAASCSMTPAMQAQLSGAAAAAAGAAANVSSEEQTILAGQAASEAALAAGLTAEKAAQAAGTAAANTAQSAGLSPQLQASLAASAAAQSAQVNQLSAEQQTQLAGEAAASAGASANMSMAELTEAAASAAESVALDAGLTPTEAVSLSTLARQQAEERADCQLHVDELRCLERCANRRSLMMLDSASRLICNGTFDEKRMAEEITFEMDFWSRPSTFAQQLLLVFGGRKTLGVAQLRPGSVLVNLAVSGNAPPNDFEELQAALSDLSWLKTSNPIFATLKDPTSTSTIPSQSTLSGSTSTLTTSTVTSSQSGMVTSSDTATTSMTRTTSSTTLLSASSGSWRDVNDPKFRVDLAENPQGLGVEVHIVLAAGATLMVTFAVVMWCCMRKAAASIAADAQPAEFGGILPAPKAREAWMPRSEAEQLSGVTVPQRAMASPETAEAMPDADKAWPKLVNAVAEVAEGAPETPRRERVGGLGTSSLIALEEADHNLDEGNEGCEAEQMTYSKVEKAEVPVNYKPDILEQLLSELQDENDPNDFNLPEDAGALQDLFGVLGDTPPVAIPPERGHTAWSLPGDVEVRSSPNSTATLLQ